MREVAGIYFNIGAVGIADEPDLQAELLGHVAGGQIDHDAVSGKLLERGIFVSDVEADVIERAALGPGGGWGGAASGG